ncbi:methyltransferase [Salix suchowensis]|nr:methyltransferase [Salix suchowensis]
MASPNQQYHATFKPHKQFSSNSPFFFRKTSLYTLALVLFLCTFSYLFGVWRHDGGGVSVSKSAATTSTIVSNPSHHKADDLDVTSTSEVKTYPSCNVNFSEYTPCEDAKRSLKFNRHKLIYRERHCPEKHEMLSVGFCLVHNVPHKHLTVEKAVQNWIRFLGDRFRFPGGGTMFPDGADAYIDDIGRLINLKMGLLGLPLILVASWGAYLLSRNILTMSFAPRDTHEAQVQFALERGVPALIGIMASKRLPYPSRAFDMAHCSRCLIPWAEFGGQYLIEVDRVLRPGGYWILSGPPINWKKYWKGWERTKDDLNDEQMKIEAVAKRDIAIWQKPINHLNCKVNRKITQDLPFCPAQDPEKAWYTNMEICLTRLPEVSNKEDVAGGELPKWPERLNVVPPRISGGTLEGITAETFQKDSSLWNRRVSYYKAVNNQLEQAGRYRNILDMNAYLGGFAAALIDDPLWVMNVVPIQAKVNTLGVIYERGLIGTYQDWCEAMSTYPRTYDLIHADSVFSLYEGRCGMENILLEMDRILRPEGSVIFRDDVDIVDHEDGPHQREKLLFAIKTYWTAPAVTTSS